MIAAVVLLLASLAMAPGLREKLAGTLSGTIERGRQAAEVFAGVRSSQADVVLPGREVYALQLGVYDSGESAAAQVQELLDEGVLSIVWQREQMRVVCAVALSRDALDVSTAGARDAYVIEDTLPRVALRLTSEESGMQDVVDLLNMPDAVLLRLLGGDSTALETIISDTQTAAKRALGAHPDNELYTQLAQSLSNWCALMSRTLETADEARARDYAAVTMCTLCRELRIALQTDAAAREEPAA